MKRSYLLLGGAAVVGLYLLTRRASAAGELPGGGLGGGAGGGGGSLLERLFAPSPSSRPGAPGTFLLGGGGAHAIPASPGVSWFDVTKQVAGLAKSIFGDKAINTVADWLTPAPTRGGTEPFVSLSDTIRSAQGEAAPSTFVGDLPLASDVSPFVGLEPFVGDLPLATDAGVEVTTLFGTTIPSAGVDLGAEAGAGAFELGVGGAEAGGAAAGEAAAVGAGIVGAAVGAVVSIASGIFQLTQGNQAGGIGTLSGVAAGAVIGTFIVPGIGTLIGAGIGGALGGLFGGLFGGGGPSRYELVRKAANERAQTALGTLSSIYSRAAQQVSAMPGGDDAAALSALRVTLADRGSIRSALWLPQDAVTTLGLGALVGRLGYYGPGGTTPFKWSDLSLEQFSRVIDYFAVDPVRLGHWGSLPGPGGGITGSGDVGYLSQADAEAAAAKAAAAARSLIQTVIAHRTVGALPGVPVSTPGPMMLVGPTPSNQIDTFASFNGIAEPVPDLPMFISVGAGTAPGDESGSAAGTTSGTTGGHDSGSVSTSGEGSVSTE